MEYFAVRVILYGIHIYITIISTAANQHIINTATDLVVASFSCVSSSMVLSKFAAAVLFLSLYFLLLSEAFSLPPRSRVQQLISTTRRGKTKTVWSDKRSFPGLFATTASGTVSTYTPDFRAAGSYVLATSLQW